ncbi:putative hydrolases or acyltransferase [Lophiostoma macrostomum CBS 122681]|uniref:Putative hydrolases or acyltransferase n=1 Tax=Lophiostoma macrostomum CBS 122681 TaxID=1314788 RepID=A0A6A6TFV3_9PLEO|nr:putative hydrolases or acyltransferase [Lophiostoma macrostomum CBS 122681]
MSSSQSNPAPLSRSFFYQNATHSYTIKWTSLGSPSSPPLIFIHGTPWSSRVWVPYALALSRQFHVYLFDNPGFGDSPLEQPLPSTPADFSKSEVERLDADLARQTEAFAALFKSWESDEEQGWKDRKPHVIAHDHAGLMSLRAHLLHGCQYASLCLMDVVAIGPFGQSLFKAVAKKPEYFEALPDMTMDGVLESYIRQAAFKELSKETMEMLKEPWLREGGKKGFIRQLCQANSRNTDAVEGRYQEVGESMPVKIIWGENDDWIPVETAKRLGEALKAKEVVTIAEAGHLIMYDQPAQLGVELGRWLTLV